MCIRDSDGGGQRGMYRAVNDLILPTAKTMGDGHACAYGQTDEEVDEQTGNGTGGAHCGDGHAAAELPHHHEISRVEQQLQKTGQNNGDGISVSYTHLDVYKRQGYRRGLVQRHGAPEMGAFQVVLAGVDGGSDDPCFFVVNAVKCTIVGEIFQKDSLADILCVAGLFLSLIHISFSSKRLLERVEMTLLIS